MSGTLHLPKGRLAYVSQDGFIMPGSIKDNVLFDLPMRAELYRRCIDAVALDTDIACLPLQDEHPAAQLSGGQRARVALCRALYSQADLCATFSNWHNVELTFFF